MKFIVIKTCEDCPHSFMGHTEITCGRLNWYLSNYPKIPKECPLDNYKDPKIQYQD
jgi:hypothetical protein